ncbi:MAG TPA: M12 family metallopeptidase [Xanthomonadales bacterium]|nr:M12 family metallopeptidase [Xanthomonadales bacterium]
MKRSVALVKKSAQEGRIVRKMITRGWGILLLVCLSHLADSTHAQQTVASENEVIRARVDGARASDLSGAGQGNGLPWANGRFVYEFSPEVQLDPRKMEAFEQACRRLLENTALKCVNRSQAVAMGDRDYVYVVAGNGDASYVGRQGGKQLLSILIWNNPNIISHEIKHALGWGHEQQHPNRDEYVDILFENIPLEKQENFYVHDNGNEGDYDFDSVMHYYPTDFSRPARKSIRAKRKYQSYQSVMGQRDHLSKIDLLEIQEFYGDSSVEWCGISRKPRGSSNLAGFSTGCPWVCRLQSNPSVGAWVPGENCDTSSGQM